MEVMQVADGVFAAIGVNDSIYEGWGANQGFVVTDGGVVVIDTGFTRPRASGLLREIRRVTGRRVRLVVNTHDHSDHTFGNSVFREAGATMISHSVCRRRFSDLGPGRIARYRQVDSRMRARLSGLSVAVPELSYEHGMTFSVGDTPISFIHPEGGAHTLGDTMVLLPRQNVLFAGDVLWTHYHPNLEDSNIPGWIDALKEIKRLDLAAVVPGHGRPSPEGAIDELADYLLAFDSQFAKLRRQDVPMKQIAGRLKLPHSKSWELKMIVKMNVEALYGRIPAGKP